MPIIFAQPSPMGEAASIGVGAGAAAATQKMAPTLAQMYEHIADLRSRSGSGGGGGGSSGSSASGVGDGGSDAGWGAGQVMGQANREQRAMDLGFESETPDYVGQHIQAQQQFKAQQQDQAQQQQAAQLDALNKQSQPAPSFSSQDAKDLDTAQQQVNTIESDFENGLLTPEDSDALVQRQQAQQKIAALQQKQQGAQQYQNQQAFQAKSQGQAQQDSLAVVRAQHLNKFMPTPVDDIPGMPKSHYIGFDQHGIPVDSNAKIRESYASHYWKAQAESANAGTKDEAVKTKQANDQYHQDYAAAAKNLSKNTDGTPRHPGHEEIEEERQKIESSREASMESKNLEKNADPKVRAAYQEHLDSIPRGEGDKPDWNKASNGQLAKTGQFLLDPKAVGVPKKEAQQRVDQIRKVLKDRDEARNAPPIDSIPPPPARPGLLREMFRNYASADHSK